MFTSKKTKIVSNIVLAFLTACCLLPFVLVFMASITDETTLLQNGYALFPEKFGFAAYQYLFYNASTILRSYGITITVTVLGTILSLLFTMLIAYPLSIPGLPHRQKISFFVYFTMLFSGGIIPTYMMWSSYLGVKNTIWGLILPQLLVKAFYVIMMKTYFINNIPQAVVESARIDGARELYLFVKIVIPISLPMISSLALLIGLGYWNDWINGLYFVTDPDLYSIQNLLNRMLREIQFLASGGAGGESVVLPSIGIRMAIAVIGVIPIVVIYPFVQNGLVKGMVVGAVKG